MDEVFSEPGFRVMWALHRDHADHLHAHVIVRALSRFGDRIRCDRAGDYLFGVRTIFAQNLQRAGLEYTATRREDRGQLREAIIAGYEPLRTNRYYKVPFLDDDEKERQYAIWLGAFFGGSLPLKPDKQDYPAKRITDRQIGRRKKKLEKELRDIPAEYSDLIGTG